MVQTAKEKVAAHILVLLPFVVLSGLRINVALSQAEVYQVELHIRKTILTRSTIFWHFLLETEEEVVEFEIVVNYTGMVHSFEYGDHLLREVVYVIPRKIKVLLKEHPFERLPKSLHYEISVEILHLILRRALARACTFSILAIFLFPLPLTLILVLDQQDQSIGFNIRHINFGHGALGAETFIPGSRRPEQRRIRRTYHRNLLLNSLRNTLHDLDLLVEQGCITGYLDNQLLLAILDVPDGVDLAEAALIYQAPYQELPLEARATQLRLLYFVGVVVVEQGVSVHGIYKISGIGTAMCF